MMLIHEALAHETIFPHVHPHAHFTAAEDIVCTFLFVGAFLGISKLLLALKRGSASSREPGEY